MKSYYLTVKYDFTFSSCNSKNATSNAFTTITDTMTCNTSENVQTEMTITIGQIQNDIYKLDQIISSKGYSTSR